MDDAAGMGEIQRIRRLLDYSEHPRKAQVQAMGLGTQQPFTHGTPRDVFHDDEGPASILTIIVDRHDVRMGEPGNQPRLNSEALEEVLFLGALYPRRDHFDRDIPFQARLIGLVDARHPSLPDQLDDLILAQ